MYLRLNYELVRTQQSFFEVLPLFKKHGEY